MVANVRTVKTSPAATAVQIVWSSRRGSRNIEHIGSAHDDAELEALKASARQRLAAGQMELDLGLGGPGPAAPLEIASSRMNHLWNALCRAYDALGFPQATGSDEVFRQLVLARIIEPTSKQDSLRVLEEAGLPRRRAGNRTGSARFPVPASRLLPTAGESGEGLWHLHFTDGAHGPYPSRQAAWHDWRASARAGEGGALASRPTSSDPFAVSSISGTAPSTAQSSWLRNGTTWPAGTHVYSAYPPSKARPMPPISVATC